MEQLIPQDVEIARLIETINPKDAFSCLREEYFDFTTGVEYKNTALLTNSLLIKLAVFLKGKSNSIEKKEFVKKLLNPEDKDQVKFWDAAKQLYTTRIVYLPVEHADNNVAIIKEFIRMPNAKELYKSISDYASIQIGKDYNTLNDAAKISAEKLYWNALFEDSINDKGLERLEEEKTRYRRALALLPAEFTNKYPQFPLVINPLEYVLSVLKVYSEALTTTVVNS